MRIRFNGIVETRRRGCSACGKAHTTIGFRTTKKYILPSGAFLTFRAGRCYEVSNEDAAFLMTYQYKDANGNTVPVFEVCDG